MKTHDLAEALRTISKLLKSGPNVEVAQMEEFGIPGFLTPPRLPPKLSADLPLALSALVSLSRIDKREWISLIDDLGLKVDLRPRDASRDIMGKVLRLLESEPEAREQLSRRVKNRTPHASPELARALSSLLNG
jgi:hypothetical protein